MAGLLLLAAANILFAALAWHRPTVPLTQWRKGPVMHARSLYGPVRAPRIFWSFTIVLLDVYVVCVFLTRRTGRNDTSAV